jgi:hypothetical protein
MVLVVCVLSVLCMGNTGCDKAREYKQRGDKTAEIVTVTANGVTFAVDAADPIVAQLEKASGVNLNPEIAEKGANIANKASAGLKTTAGFVSMVPGGQTIANAILALSTLAGGIGAFLQKRKRKEAEAESSVAWNEAGKQHDALKAVVKAVDSDELKGVGKIITDATLKAGCADLVEEAYNEVTKEVPLGV